MIRGSRYVIAVHDLARSAAFYRDIVGFEILDIDAPGWCFMRREGCFIMAGECRDAIAPAKLGDHSYFAYLEVDDIDRLHEDVVGKGASLVKKLQDEPWRMREFGLRTADGHRIMFGQAI